MATTSLPTSQQLDWTGNAILAQDLVLTGSVYKANPVQAGGSTVTLTASNAGQTIFFDTATGTIVTLPAATGTGNKYTFVVKVLATSNSHVINTASASDKFSGVLMTANTSTNAVTGWPAANNKVTVTLNRTTTGSVTIGEQIEIQDIATNLWSIGGQLTQSGTAATPFS